MKMVLKVDSCLLQRISTAAGRVEKCAAQSYTIKTQLFLLPPLISQIH